MLDTSIVSIILLLLTLIALFGDDVRLGFFSASSDLVFDCLMLFCLIMFSIEIILQFIGKEDYGLLSFYFWLDFIALISLIADIYFIMDISTGEE